MKMTRTFTACAILASLSFSLMAMQCDVTDVKADETSGLAVEIAQDLWGDLGKIATQQEIKLGNGSATGGWFSLVKAKASFFEGSLFEEIRINVLNTYLALATKLLNYRGALTKSDEERVLGGLEKMVEGIKPEFYQFVYANYGARIEAQARDFFVNSGYGRSFFVLFFIPGVLMETDYKRKFPLIFDAMGQFIRLWRDVFFPVVTKTTHECGVAEIFERINNLNFCAREFVRLYFEFFEGSVDFFEYDFEFLRSNADKKPIILGALNKYNVLAWFVQDPHMIDKLGQRFLKIPSL